MVPDMEKIELLKKSVIESNNILPYINLMKRMNIKGGSRIFIFSF